MDKTKHKIRFDLFNFPGGKWKYGGEVEVSYEIWDSNFLPELIENQNEVVKSAFAGRQYYMVIDHILNDKSNKFYKHLFQPYELDEAYNNCWKLL